MKAGQLLPAVVVMGLLLFCAGWSRAKEARGGAEDPQRAQAFRNVNIAQWGAILALLVTLNVIQHVEWIVPGIMLIVGLHFFPLAKLFRNRMHYFTGAALAALALTYPFLAAGGPASPVGAIGAALILWVTAASMLKR